MLTRQVKDRYPYGAPNPKPLPQWFYKLDLDRFNILVRKPVDVVNFVIEHMIYTTDQEAHQVPEYWLQSPEDIYTWLFDKRMDDCDGSAITVASILYSLGNPHVRLALGYYGNDAYANTKVFQMNHAYCLLEIGPSKYKLLDAVGDRPVEWLEDIDFCPLYHTMISASADGRVWYHNSWV